MARFDAKAQNNDVLRDQHNVLVDQLNKWVPVVDADTLDSLHSTDFIRTTNSTSFLPSTGTSTNSDRLDGLHSTDFLGSTGTSTNSDRLDSLHSTDFVRSTTITYEESTWLPTWVGQTQAGTITLAAGSTGKYVRVGHTITLYAQMTVTAIAGSSGNLKLTGLPYYTNGGGQFLDCITNGVNWGTSATRSAVILNTSTNTGVMYGILNNAAWVATNVSGLSTSDEIRIHGTYIMAT